MYIVFIGFQYFPTKYHSYADTARCYLSFSTYFAEVIIHYLSASLYCGLECYMNCFSRLYGKDTPSSGVSRWVSVCWLFFMLLINTYH